MTLSHGGKFKYHNNLPQNFNLKNASTAINYCRILTLQNELTAVNYHGIFITLARGGSGRVRTLESKIISQVICHSATVAQLSIFSRCYNNQFNVIQHNDTQHKWAYLRHSASQLLRMNDTQNE